MDATSLWQGILKFNIFELIWQIVQFLTSFWCSINAFIKDLFKKNTFIILYALTPQAELIQWMETIIPNSAASLKQQPVITRPLPTTSVTACEATVEHDYAPLPEAMRNPRFSFSEVRILQLRISNKLILVANFVFQLKCKIWKIAQCHSILIIGSYPHFTQTFSKGSQLCLKRIIYLNYILLFAMFVEVCFHAFPIKTVLINYNIVSERLWGWEALAITIS